MAKYTDDVKALLELIGEIRSCRRKESKRKGN